MPCRKSLTPAFWWCLAALLLIFAADLLLPLGLATAACYAVVVMVANRTTSTTAVNILTGTAVVFLGIGYLAWPDLPPPYWTAAGYRISSAAALLMVARLSVQRRILIGRLERTNAKLIREGEILNGILDNIAEYVFLHDVSGRYLYASRRALEMAGVKSLDDLSGKTWQELGFPAEIMENFDSDLQQAAVTGKPVTRELRAFFDGAWRDCECTLTRVDVSPQGPPLVVGTVRDISERIAYVRQLRHQATHDDLTGIPNRVLFVERLEHALERLRRKPAECPLVVCLSVDKYRQIGDLIGHAAGDEFLRKIASRLSETVRPGDTVARIDGETFAVLFAAVCDAESAEHACDRVCKAIGEPIKVGRHEFHTTASIGLVLVGPQYHDAEDVLRDADIALQYARQRGGDQIAPFSADMLASVVKAARLEHDLKWAVRRRELVWWYQPVVRLDTGRISGFEALVRWPTEKGIIPPAEFIPLAEKSGVITEIDWLALETAGGKVAQFLSENPEYRPFHLHVNLSPRNFMQPNLVENITALLERIKLPADCLQLEVTEEALEEEPERVKVIMEALRGKGVGFSCDDFGVGYSGLAHLNRFPFDVIKVDRSFTSQMLESQEHRAIVEAIVVMARILNLTVIVEGIETQAQLDALKDLGCQYGQGFLFSRPLPWDEAVAQLGLRH